MNDFERPKMGISTPDQQPGHTASGEEPMRLVSKPGGIMLVVGFLMTMLWVSGMLAAANPTSAAAARPHIFAAPLPAARPISYILPGHSADANPVTLSLPAISGTIGQPLTINLTLDTSIATRGGMFGLSFNPAVLHCDGVDEGTFYSSWAQSNGDHTLAYPQAVCDNTTGTISDMGIAIVGSHSGGPSGSGVMAVLHFTVLANGLSPLTLSDVEIDDTSLSSKALAVTINSGQVTVGTITTPTKTSTPTITPTPTKTLPGASTSTRTVTSTNTSTPDGSQVDCSRADVNGDGKVGIGDVTLVGIHWGETGSDGWIPEDINQDGKVGIGDVTVIGICWGWTSSGPTSTSTLTATVTKTGQATQTDTMTATVTQTGQATPTNTATATVTQTGQATLTNTATFTVTPSPSVSPTATGQSDVTPSVTPTTIAQLLAVGPTAAVNIGQAFTVPIDINVQQASKGAMFGMTFDPAVLKCNGVDEGTFYKSWAQSNGVSTLVFPSATCDNTSGTISDMGIAITGNTNGNGPSGSGLMATVRFTALASGSSALTLIDGEVDDADQTRVHALPLGLVNGQVTVSNTVAASATPTLTATATRTRTPTTQSGSTATFTATTQSGSASRTPTSTKFPTLPPSHQYSATPTATPDAAVNLSFTPALKDVSQGDSFTVDIEITTNKASRGAQAAVSFDPTLLSCDGVDEGTFYSSWAQSNNGSTLLFPTGAINNTAGTIGDTGISVQASGGGQSNPNAHLGGPTGNGSFLTLHFTAKANGVANLSLTDIEIDDDTAQANSIGSSGLTGQVFIGVTPTPTTAGTSSGSATATSASGSGYSTATPAYLSTSGSGTPTVPVNAEGTPLPTPNATEVAMGTPAVVVAPTVPVDTTVTQFDLTGQVDANGIFSKEVEFTSPDGLCTVRFGRGVQALTADNHLLRAITMQHVAQSPPAGKKGTLVGVACQLGPTGANFDPAASLLLQYDRSQLPKGVLEKGLAVAYYDDSARQWVALKSQVDTGKSSVIAQVSHFSTYSLLYQPGGLDGRMLLAAGLALALLLAAGIYFYLWRRKQRLAAVKLAPEIIYLLPPTTGTDPWQIEASPDQEALPLPEPVEQDSEPPKSIQEEEL